MTIPLAEEQRCEAVSTVKGNGRRIFGLACTPADQDPRGLVVLPPGYERRIHHYSVLSRYLIRHGYATLRFDCTDHIGLSDGEIFDFTMSSMAGDVACATAQVPDALAELPRYLVASSLAARATVRALAENAPLSARVDGAVLILPVIDLQDTLRKVIGEDLIEEWRSGRVTDPRASSRVLDHEVAYGFARDLIDAGWDDPSGAGAELAQLALPVTAIAAAQDEWVRVDDVLAAMAAADETPGARDTVVLEAASHELSHNAPVMRLLMEQVLGALASASGEELAVEHLEFDEVMETMRSEREWKQAEYSDLTICEVTS
ncbi:MAG: alpha/beta hydrolase [Solirubrobacterales bacterium]|nr:alpha/beta hydrolase [Solirubrobacterales bacterium]